MLLDIFVQLVLEYQPEDRIKKERDLFLIAKRYLKEQFLIDLLAVFPFNYLFTT